MPQGSITNNAHNSLIAEITEEIQLAYDRYKEGLFDQRETEKDIDLLIKKLRVYEKDCQPADLQSAEEILTKIKNEPAPNGIFDKLRQVFLDWRGKSRTFKKVPISSIGMQELNKLRKDIIFTDLAIDHARDIFANEYNILSIENLQKLSSALDHSLATDLASKDPSIRRLATLSLKSKTCNSRCCNYSDEASGLYVSLLIDTNRKEVRVIFAGLGASGKENRSTFFSRHISIIKTALGIRTRSLEQAAYFTKKVIKAVAESQDLKDYKTVTRGYSKGAAEAVYAALAQPQPLHTICFASADLGGAHVRKLPKANVARATELITHYHIKGDSIPNLRYIVPSLRPLGKEVVIPKNQPNIKHLHGNFIDHSIAYLNSIVRNSRSERSQSSSTSIRP